MNTEHQTVFPNIYYIHNNEHRNANPNKAQWIITEPEERDCFETAAKLKYEHTCNLDTLCWGIKLNNKKVCALGRPMARASDPERELFIAKFIDGNANGKWHGYPADHEMNSHDIPPGCVLDHWLSSGFFSPAKIRKISRGQRCRL